MYRTFENRTVVSSPRHFKEKQNKPCNTKELCGTSATSCNASCKLYNRLLTNAEYHNIPLALSGISSQYQRDFFFFLHLNEQYEKIKRFSTVMLKAEVVWTKM